MKRLNSLSNEWAGLVVLLVLWAAYYYRILFLGHTVVLLDSSRFFYPLWKWGAGVWGQGLIPLWNPDAGFGTPYLADPQMAAWYPPQVLIYSLFSPTTAFNFLIVGHHLWALFGFWFFSRNRGYSTWVALAGCMIFGFSFNAASLAWITSILFTFSWIPWVFLASDRLRAKRQGSFLLLLATLAMQMAAGYPLLAYLTGLALALDWFLRLVFETKKNGWGRQLKQIGWVTLAVAGALAYNAAWLLPLREITSISNLRRRMEMWQGTDCGALATWLNPFFLGHPLFSHPDTPFNFMVYFAGLPTLVFLIWGITKRKVGKASLVFFLLLLVLSMGETVFVGGWLKTILPGYSLVVRSGYWIPLVLFSATLLFMTSAQAMTEDKSKPKRFSKSEMGWSLLSGIVFGLALWLGVPWTLWSFWLSFLFVVFAGIPSRVPLAWRSVFLILSLLFSLGPVVRSINFSMDKAIYEIKPVLYASLNKAGRLYESPDLVDSFQTVAGKSVGDVFEKQKESLVPNWPLGLGLEEVGFANSIFLAPYFEFYVFFALPITLDYLNVRYVIGKRPSGDWKEVVVSGFPLSLWENPNVFPKWFSVKNAFALPSVDSNGGMGMDLSIDFKKECYISDASRKGDYSSRFVKEVSRTPSRIELMAVGKGQALLVSSELAFPGWKARVGGEWRSFEEVNHGFRGVVLENDEEMVTLLYQPTSFRLGCFLSLLVCGLCMGMILNLGRKTRYA